MLVLVVPAAVALVVGCATQQPFEPPYEEVDLSSVEAQAGVLTADQVAGRAYAGVNVTVLESAAPVAGVVVRLLPVAPENLLDTYPHATTEGDGHVRFNKVPTGASLKVRAELAAPQSANVSPTAGVLSEFTLGE
jgi:hypothetical protein